jgi:phosphohistidine swiveling domain-containing protein
MVSSVFSPKDLNALEEFKASLGSNPGVIVLEKNENSFLVDLCKHSTVEFFDRVFSSGGAFWSAYKDLLLGVPPIDKKYLVVLSNQLFFCKNIERDYIFSSQKKKFFVKKGHLFLGNGFGLDFFMDLLCAPFEKIIESKSVIVDAFKINELFLDFGKELSDSNFSVEKALSRNVSYTDAGVYLSKAAYCMRFSFLASLAFSLKLKPNPKVLAFVEEAKSFFENNNSSLNSKNAFFSKNVYDISQPRIGETKQFVSLPPLPSNPWLVLRESARLCCARHLFAERVAFLSAAKQFSIGELVFHLTSKEIDCLVGEKAKLKELALERKIIFEKLELMPKRILFDGSWNFGQEESAVSFAGLSVGSKLVVRAPVSWVHSEKDLSKNFFGKIIIADYFSPQLVVAYSGALGIISSVGGALSHPAIVAREKNLPCLVQVDGISSINENAVVELDGVSGRARLAT